MINIKINKSNKCNGEYSLYVSFPYDPIIVNKIKEQSIRYYNPETREWELPVKSFDKLKEALKDYEINISKSDEDLFKSIFIQKEYNYIPKDYKFKITPFKHQIEGVNYGLKYDRFLLGDEQGLGKTMQAINIACIKKQQKHYKHCLIICGVNGLKWNWKSEVEKHSNEQAWILGTRYDKKGKEKIGSLDDRLTDLLLLERMYSNNAYIPPDLCNCYIDKNYFLITNIETLRNEEIIKKLKELCDKKIINMIVLDERSQM